MPKRMSPQDKLFTAIYGTADPAKIAQAQAQHRADERSADQAAEDMALQPDDLSRPIMIHCCKDGTITYRTLQQRVFNGRALPVFSVDTEKEAEDLQVLLCKLQYGTHPLQPDRPWYAFRPFSGQLDDLIRVSKAFRDGYALIKSRRVS